VVGTDVSKESMKVGFNYTIVYGLSTPSTSTTTSTTTTTTTSILTVTEVASSLIKEETNSSVSAVSTEIVNRNRTLTVKESYNNTSVETKRNNKRSIGDDT
jgi:hypothetical protein